MERRVFITLVACVLFSLVYFRLSPQPRPPVDATGHSQAPPKTASGDATRAGAGAPTGPDDGNGTQTSAVPGDDAPGAFPVTDVAAVDVPPFESDFNLYEFTNRGGGIAQVYLKEHYRKASDRDVEPKTREQWVAMFPPPENSFGPAFGLRTIDRAGVPLDQSNWEYAEETEDGHRVVVFRFQRGDGLRLEKRLACIPDRHYLECTLRVTTLDAERRGAMEEFLVRAAGGINDVVRGQWTLEPQGVAGTVDQYHGYEVKLHTAKQLHDEPVDVLGTSSREVAWAGVSNLYFTTLLEPMTEGGATAAALRAASPERAGQIGAELQVPVQLSRDGEVAGVTFRLFVGAKDPKLMEREGLEPFIALVEHDYGSWESFRWINKLLLGGLRLFNGWFGNFGLAIILLTLILRVALFPITRTQQVSMQRYSLKMAALKPKLDELRERFKNNSQRYAQEQMKLLREHNVRPPVVGCLTSFVTIPVFVGMFQILRSSIDLRQAPFAGWIDDLSLPDHLFMIPGIGIAFNLLPILATLAFLLQMRLAPKSADPQAQQQQKIMMIMPLVFGVMFYGYAAGLSLYMLTSSAYGIFEYKFIRQRFFPQPVPAAAR